MKIKVGDTVRFKTEQELISEFGRGATRVSDIDIPHGFNSSMAIFCGRRGKIVAIDTSSNSTQRHPISLLRIEFDDSDLTRKSRQWTITTDMINKSLNLHEIPSKYWGETTPVDKLEEMV
jgi:hypothetical protein